MVCWDSGLVLGERKIPDDCEAIDFAQSPFSLSRVLDRESCWHSNRVHANPAFLFSLFREPVLPRFTYLTFCTVLSNILIKLSETLRPVNLFIQNASESVFSKTVWQGLSV